MISEYLNQTVTHKTVSSVNNYNEKTYSSTSTSARFIYKREIIRNADGEEITSNAIVYTKTELNEGDVITYDSKDWVVRFVYPWMFLDGSVMGYKGVL